MLEVVKRLVRGYVLVWTSTARRLLIRYNSHGKRIYEKLRSKLFNVILYHYALFTDFLLGDTEAKLTI
jgi:hypothetical protein